MALLILTEALGRSEVGAERPRHSDRRSLSSVPLSEPYNSPEDPTHYREMQWISSEKHLRQHEASEKRINSKADYFGSYALTRSQ